MPYDIGLVGATGIAARAVIAPSRRTPDFRVVAVAASDPDRAAVYAREHDIPRVHAGYSALVEDPDVDVVYVSLHNSAHHRWALAAARAGKHVVVEKPICLTPAEAEDLRDAGHAAGVAVVEAVPTAGHPWQDTVRAMAADGPFGSLRHIRTRMRFAPPRPGGYRDRVDLGGGIFLDTASYWLQAVQAVVGLEPARGTGASAFDGPNGVDREFRATLAVGNGVTAVLQAQVGEPHVAEHEFVFDDAAVRLRHFLRPTAGALPLNLAIRFADGTRQVRSFPPVAYYDRQLANVRKLLAGGPVDASAAANQFGARITSMAAIYQDARRVRVKERA
ncbi:Gfo/Idh/MocA family oxidoreductase [Actinoplanes sp. NPDC051346]|uniref:Gfo/Idh/MocA family protein n=1 Tax=Actinoplanes sp. NPDC051346 TaxID=3155048 RepID=UPI0034370114